MVIANCRTQFTADDFNFVVRVLAKSPKESISLVSLLSSEEERNAILDHELIYQNLVDRPECLTVSAAFYFYIVTRHVLRRAALPERELTDYVAALLLKFAQVKQFCTVAPGENEQDQGSFGYISDVMSKLQQASAKDAFALQSHLANYLLFLCGIFADRVQAQAQRRGAPGLSYYEAVGQVSYQRAARHPLSRQCQLQAIYEQLSSEFHHVRLALNNLADTLFHLHATPDSVLSFSSPGKQV